MEAKHQGLGFSFKYADKCLTIVVYDSLWRPKYEPNSTFVTPRVFLRIYLVNDIVPGRCFLSRIPIIVDEIVESYFSGNSMYTNICLLLHACNIILYFSTFLSRYK